MTRTVEEKTTIASGWRTSGLTQPAYAAQHNISERTLRLWLTKFAPKAPQSSAEVFKVLITAMQSMLKLYQAVGLDPREVLARHPEAAATLAAARPAPVPMPRPF